MARKPQIWLPEVTYHCYSRCIELRNLLSEIWVKDMAVEVLNITLEKYNFQLIQVEFVDNHFHFTIRTVKGGENISRIMQYIKARIAENYNRKMNRTGPFWNERFKCKIIEHAKNPFTYFINLALYMGYNSVTKGLLKNPQDSKYNTFRIMVEEDYIPPVKITFHPFFLSLGDTHSQRIQKFKVYEKAYRKRLHMMQPAPSL